MIGLASSFRQDRKLLIIAVWASYPALATKNLLGHNARYRTYRAMFAGYSLNIQIQYPAFHTVARIRNRISVGAAQDVGVPTFPRRNISAAIMSQGHLASQTEGQSSHR